MMPNVYTSVIQLGVSMSVAYLPSVNKYLHLIILSVLNHLHSSWKYKHCMGAELE